MKIQYRLSLLICLILCSSAAKAQMGKSGGSAPPTLAGPPMAIEDAKAPGAEESALPKDVYRRRNPYGGKPVFTVEVKKGQVLVARDRCSEYAIADLLDENDKALKKKTLPTISKNDVYLMQAGDVKLSRPVVLATDGVRSRGEAYWSLEVVFGAAHISAQRGSGESTEEEAIFHFQVPVEFHNLKDEILAKVTEVECSINPKFFGPSDSRNLKVMNPEGAIVINGLE